MPAAEKEIARGQVETLLSEMHDAKEYGSIINVTDFDMELLRKYLSDREESRQLNVAHIGAGLEAEKIWKLAKIGKVLAQKYDAVVTNPPYMGGSGMGGKLSEYIKKFYSDSKTDLFAVFIERCGQMTNKNCYQAMITQHAWMFLSSFEKFRNKLQMVDIVNMAHLGARAFDEIGGEVVQTTSFVIHKRHIDRYKGVYQRLIDGRSQKEKEAMFYSSDYIFTAAQCEFSKIPGSPVAYWVGKALLDSFDMKQMKDFTVPRMGLTTGDNEYYLRLWHEVNWCGIGFKLSRDSAKASKLKWFPYNKGGEFRKWYGNQEYVVNWYNDGYEMQSRLHPDGNRIWAHNFNLEFNFKKHISWNDLTSKGVTFRAFGDGFLFDSSAAVVFVSDDIFNYMLGYLNTKYVNKIAQLLNPTMHFKLGDFEKVPFRIEKKQAVEDIVIENISLSRTDWDSFETSWDFGNHPLVRPVSTISDAYTAWQDEGKPIECSEEALNFGTFCIQALAEHLAIPDEEVYLLLTEKSNLLDGYILKHWEVLHTQGKKYIVEDLMEALQEKGIAQ